MVAATDPAIVLFIISFLLPNGRFVWKNIDRRREYRPHCVRSVRMTEVKIPLYRPIKLG